MATVALPNEKNRRREVVLMPDGLLHPRYRGKQSGVGLYLSCRREVFKYIGLRCKSSLYILALISDLRRIVRGDSAFGQIHASLPQYISQQLRERVIQEVELLGERLRCNPEGSLSHSVVRRIPQSAWKKMLATGMVEALEAAAILDFSPKAKQSSSGTVALRRFFKMSSARQHLPEACVPCYNPFFLFPEDANRERLRKALSAVLAIERCARWRQTALSPAKLRATTTAEQRAKNKSIRFERRTLDQPSSAFLISSTATTITRADSVPLLIALWRVCLWEGEAWNNDDPYGGWKVSENECRAV
jgi:hypothetical protein